jgi:hypothetical protein
MQCQETIDKYTLIEGLISFVVFVIKSKISLYEKSKFVANYKK